MPISTKRRDSRAPRRVPNFRMRGPQFIIDDWNGGKVHELRFVGCCHTCGRRCYFFPTNSNDPRGMLGDHALGAEVHYTLARTREPAPEHHVYSRVQCFECNNDEHTYTAFVNYVKRRVASGAWVLTADDAAGDWKWLLDAVNAEKEKVTL